MSGASLLAGGGSSSQLPPVAMVGDITATLIVSCITPALMDHVNEHHTSTSTTAVDPVAAALKHISQIVVLRDCSPLPIHCVILVPAGTACQKITQDSLSKRTAELKPDDVGLQTVTPKILPVPTVDCLEYLKCVLASTKMKFLHQMVVSSSSDPSTLPLLACFFDFALEAPEQLPRNLTPPLAVGRFSLFFKHQETFLVDFLLEPGKHIRELVARSHLRWLYITSCHPDVRPKVVDQLMMWTDPCRSSECETTQRLGMLLKDAESFGCFFDILSFALFREFTVHTAVTTTTTAGGREENDYQTPLYLEPIMQRGIFRALNVAFKKAEGRPTSENSPPDIHHNITRFIVSKNSEMARKILLEKNECSICHDTPTNAISLEKCGHIFCLSCMNEHFKYQQSCPLCRGPLARYQYFLSPCELLGFCSTCDWKGIYQDYVSQEHQVNCPHLRQFSLGAGDLLDATYSGSLENNMIHGEGILTFSNGDKYEGGWKGGKMDGYGTFTTAGGTVLYQGEWKDGCPAEQIVTCRNKRRRE